MTWILAMKMKRAYLIVSGSSPVGDPSRIRDALLEAMGPESTERDTRSAEQRAYCPEWGH